MTPSELREGIAKAIFPGRWADLTQEYHAATIRSYLAEADAIIAYLETQPLRVCLRDDTYSKGNASVVTVALADWLKEGAK